MDNKFKITKYACYMTNVCMSIVACVSPILYVTFNEMYNISYTLLGFLAVLCFGIQLIIDLIFSFFAKWFDISKTVKLTPLICFAGMMIYSVMPALFPQAAYLWIMVGIIISSISAGLCEVLISPVVAAIPSDNPDREMSFLHSVYGWGVVGVVILTTVLLTFIGRERWYIVSGLWGIVPLITFVLFMRAKMPEVSVGVTSERDTLPKGMLLFVICIFLGGASECTMTQWCSGFLEKSAGIPKIYGDIFGLAVFAFLLALGRTFYSKYGKNIYRTLILCMTGTALCYITATLSGNPVISLLGCIFTGFSTSMLWPGSLIFMENKYKNAGVTAYALMAAGGDAGGSVGPQLVGALADAVMASNRGKELALNLSLTTEQLALKVGLLSATMFPVLGIILLLCMMKFAENK